MTFTEKVMSLFTSTKYKAVHHLDEDNELLHIDFLTQDGVVHLCRVNIQNFEVPEAEIYIGPARGDGLKLYFSSSSTDDFFIYLSKLKYDFDLLSDHYSNCYLSLSTFLGVTVARKLNIPQNPQLKILNRFQKSHAILSLISTEKKVPLFAAT